MFRNVIVGVDRHGSRDAIAVANRLLAPGGELTLAHVFPGTLQISQGPPQVASPERRGTAEMIDRAAEVAGLLSDHTHASSTALRPRCRDPAQGRP